MCAIRISDSGTGGDFKPRFVASAVLVLFFFGALLARVWYLQIYQGRQFKAFSERNRITVRTIPATRGRILDRHGGVLAESRSSFDLTVTRAEVEGGLDVLMGQLADILGWDSNASDRAARIVRSAGNPHAAVVVDRDMARDSVARVFARQYALSGVEVRHMPARFYPFGSHGSHLLGYLGEIDERRMESLREEGDRTYRLGDFWGISGIEKSYESVLRGRDGARPFIKDARGREVGEEFSADLLAAFRAREAVPGTDIVLSLDMGLQAAAEDAFHFERGAVVVMDVENGDILALVSRPEYLPGRFARGVSADYWAGLTRDVADPLYDRALQGVYPPGSTFKIVTGMALLDVGIDPLEKVFCPGWYRLGREVKRCWKKEGHGWMDFSDAIKQSCNVYFYEMGRRLGVDRMAAMARKLGLGSPTGISINRERPGLIPTQAWKERVFKEPWVGGETLSVAIGQVYVQVTPIQMAVATAALVNGGTLYQPRIALRSISPDGGILEEFPVVVRRKEDLNEEHRQRVMDALRRVVNEPGGTAYWFGRSKVVEIAGKTGTSQVVGRQAEVQIKPHAWFISYAPADYPKIAVSVLVEFGEHGSVAAAPIARKVIEAYLGGPG